MAKPQEVPIVPELEQQEFAPLETELPRLQSEAVEAVKERDRLDPIEDAEEIQELVQQTGEVVEADRLVTGARATPLPQFLDTAIGVLPRGPEQVVRAMLPRKILTPQENERAKAKFRNEVIPEIFDDYLNDIDEQFNQGNITRSKRDAAYELSSDDFADLIQGQWGERGQWLITDEQGRIMTGLNILGTEILGGEKTLPDDVKPAVVEAWYGSLLRDFLIIESGVTAVGQEVMSWVPLKGFQDTVGADDPVFERWAKNQQMGYGIEELAADIGEAPTRTLQNAARLIVEEVGIKGLTGPDDTMLEEFANEDELAERVGEGLWWIGLAGSFLLPMDMYIGRYGKGGVKAAATAGARAGKWAQEAAGFTTKSATEQTPFVGRFLGRTDLGDDLGLNPADIRLDIVESNARSSEMMNVAQEALSGGEVSAGTKAALEEAGIPVKDGKVPDGELQGIVRGAAERGRKYLTDEQDLRASRDADDVTGTVQGVKTRVEDFESAVVKDGVVIVNDNPVIIRTSKLGLDPESGQWNLAGGERRMDAPRRGAQWGDEGAEVSSRLENEEIAGRFIQEQVAIEIAKRKAQRALETGRKRVRGSWWTPKELVLLTPRVAVPNGLLPKIRKQIANEKVNDTNLGGVLSEISANAQTLQKEAVSPTPKADAVIGAGETVGPKQEAILKLKLAFEDLHIYLLDKGGNTLAAKQLIEDLNSFIEKLKSRPLTNAELTELAIIQREAFDLIAENVAYKLAPNKVMSIADLEKVFVESKKIVEEGTVAPSPGDPTKLVGGQKVQPRVDANRITRIRAAANIEDINNLVRPPELKKSGFTQTIKTATNYITGGKGVKGVGAVGRGPAYKIALKRLTDRLGNLDEEARLSLKRTVQDIKRNPEEFAAKYGVDVDEVRSYENIISFGAVNESVFRTPTAHFVEFLKVGHGSVDDIGVLVSTRYGQQLLAKTDQAAINKVINSALSDPENILHALARQAETFDSFSPAYFEWLAGVNVLLGGKRMSSYMTDLQQRRVFGQETITANTPGNSAFMFDPNKLGENLGILYYNGLRTQAINDFAKGITRRYPELFTPSNLPDRLPNTRVSISAASVKNTLSDLPWEVQPYREITYQSGGPGYAIAEGINPVLRQAMEADPNLYRTLVKAAVEDRIVIAEGGVPRAVEELLSDLVTRDNSKFANDVHRRAREWAEENPEGKEVLRYLNDVLPPPEAVGATVISFASRTSTEGDVPSVFTILLQEILQNELYASPKVNRILNESYYADATKAVPPERVADYFKILKEQLEESIKEPEVRTTFENNLTSEITAGLDLPTYVFDTPGAIRADVAGFLDSGTINSRFRNLNQVWENRGGLNYALMINRAIVGDGEGIAVGPGLGAMGELRRTNDPQLIVEFVANAEKALSEAGDDAGSIAFTRMLNGVFAGMGQVPGRAGNIAKSGVLGGNILPNPKYHVMNVLSAPAIMMSTIGLKAGARASVPNLASTKVLRELYSYDLPGVPKVVDPNEVVISIDAKKLGGFVEFELPMKQYTVGDLADLVMRAGINQSQSTAEIRINIYRDLVAWTGQNMRDTQGKVPVKIKEYLRLLKGQLGGDRTVWSDFANAMDSYYRTNVLINALREGKTERAAIDLAREALFDYNNLTRLEREYVTRGIWIYTFQAQNWRTTASNIVNNPTRMLQAYKLARGMPSDEEDDQWKPFISRYKNSKIFIGIKKDPETAKRYALYGPDVPMVDAFADLVWATEGFLALSTSAAKMDTEGIGGQIREKGITALESSPPAFQLGGAMAGIQVQFGDLVVDEDKQSGYINPAYIQWLTATGNWDSFKTQFNVEARQARTGKATYEGFEWRINPRDGNAKKRWQKWQKAFIFVGQERAAREYKELVFPTFTDAPGFEQQKTLRYDLQGPLVDFGVDIGALGVEQLPDVKEMEQRILYEAEKELGVK